MQIRNNLDEACNSVSITSKIIFTGIITWYLRCLPRPILESSRQLYLPPFVNENFNDPNLSLFEKSPSPAPQQLKESLKNENYSWKCAFSTVLHCYYYNY